MTKVKNFKPVVFWFTGPPREYGAYRFHYKFLIGDFETGKRKIVTGIYPVIMGYDVMQPRHVKKMIETRQLPPINHIYEQGYICAN